CCEYVSCPPIALIALGEHGRRKIETDCTVPQLACDESYKTCTCSYVEHVSRWCRQKSFDRSNPCFVLDAPQPWDIARVRIIERCDGTPEGRDAFLHIAIVWRHRGSGPIRVSQS